MISSEGTRRTTARSAAFSALALAASLFALAVSSVGCGDYKPAATSQPGSTDGPGSSAATHSSAVTPTWEPITREDPSGVVAGLVFNEPISLDEARSVATGLRGDAIALYRTDDALVRPTTVVTDAAGGWQSEPSRFAYVDAGKIRERRVASINAGLSPPITGWSISESYWEHWKDQWARAQDPGVRFEALGLYVPKSAVEALRADPRFRGVEIVPTAGRTASPRTMPESCCWSRSPCLQAC